MAFAVGVAKKDITCPIKGVGMMGYGMYHHRVKGIKTPLMARAFIFKDSNDKKVAFVCAEILSCTIALKKSVIKLLQENHATLHYDFNNVLICGNHTHSAPAGYTQYPFYNMPVSGFAPEVLSTISQGITDAIIEADSKLQAANIRIGTGVFSEDDPVAFNRSIEAYNLNKDVKKYSYKNRHLAVDRNMTLLRIDDLKGNPIGSINWFGVHTTSVGNDLYNICADNKGYAADFLEKEIKNKYNTTDFVAAFAQAPCGDISPNFVWDKKRNRMRGASKDDYENAQENGRLQFKKALEIFENCTENLTEGSIDFDIMNADFSAIKVDPEFANGAHNATTSSGCMGVSFFEGTTDGMGISKSLGTVLKGIISIQEFKQKFTDSASDTEQAKKNSQGVKKSLMDLTEHTILGSSKIDKVLGGISFVDKTLPPFIKYYKNGSLDNQPWLPNIMPLQILTIGAIAIVAFPGEPTTVTGIRTKKLIGDILAKKGVKKVIVSAYANAFAGYITTNEEYQAQCYEGGHTIYGQWTLGGYLTKFKELANELLKPVNERKIDRTVEPAIFQEHELAKREFKGTGEYVSEPFI